MLTSLKQASSRLLSANLPRYEPYHPSRTTGLRVDDNREQRASQSTATIKLEHKTTLCEALICCGRGGGGFEPIQYNTIQYKARKAPAIKVARRELRGGRPSPSFTFLKNLTCKLSSPRYNLKLAFVLLLLASIENDVD